MSLGSILADPAWDAPFFKLLANNDTGTASGHQGGVVIPMELRPYFPSLNPKTSADVPTADARVDAVLMDGATVLGKTNTRYQFQTWGGTRTAESRLTDGLAVLRNLAKGGDFLIIQRDRESLSLYRIILVRQDMKPLFTEAKLLARGKRWGPLGAKIPLREEDYKQACIEEESLEASPFVLFEPSPTITTTTQRRLARALAFRTRIQTLYDRRCCVCGASIVTPDDLSEIEAAHIVPRHMTGVDEARNGLALCRRHHWAFDRGLFGVGPVTRTVFVPPKVLAVPQNGELRSLNGRQISEALDIKLLAHPNALDWHITNIVHRYV